MVCGDSDLMLCVQMERATHGVALVQVCTGIYIDNEKPQCTKKAARMTVCFLWRGGGGLEWTMLLLVACRGPWIA